MQRRFANWDQPGVEELLTAFFEETPGAPLNFTQFAVRLSLLIDHKCYRNTVEKKVHRIMFERNIVLRPDHPAYACDKANSERAKTPRKRQKRTPKVVPENPPVAAEAPVVPAPIPVETQTPVETPNQTMLFPNIPLSQNTMQLLESSLNSFPLPMAQFTPNAVGSLESPSMEFHSQNGTSFTVPFYTPPIEPASLTASVTTTTSAGINLASPTITGATPNSSMANVSLHDVFRQPSTQIPSTPLGSSTRLLTNPKLNPVQRAILEGVYEIPLLRDSNNRFLIKNATMGLNHRLIQNQLAIPVFNHILIYVCDGDSVVDYICHGCIKVTDVRSQWANAKITPAGEVYASSNHATGCKAITNREYFITQVDRYQKLKIVDQSHIDFLKSLGLNELQNDDDVAPQLVASSPVSSVSSSEIIQVD